MYWITHFIPEPLPKIGMKKMSFYTQQNNPEEFFSGTDNYAIPREEIEGLVSRNRIILIPHKIFLKENQTLFIDATGTMWMAQYTDSNKDRKEVGLYDAIIKKFFQDLEGSA